MAIRVRVSPVVTNEYPDIIPSTFVFDSEKLVLYLDLKDYSRRPVTDPFALTITETGGYINIIDGTGATVSNLRLGNVQITGLMEFTGEIHLDVPAEKVAVFDSTGRLRFRTLQELKQDLQIEDITLEVSTVQVLKDVVDGDLPELGTVVQDENMIFAFDSGTQLTKSFEEVVKSAVLS